MKKSHYLIVATLFSLIIFQSFELTKRRDGTDPGYTGSPGDTLKTCTVCHGGSVTTEPGWIVSNIPASGYIPGNTYQISATNTSLGYNRFGFLISPQALNGDLLGTLVVTDSNQTKLVGDGKYITYRTAGVDGNNSKTWTFNWIAPAANIKHVTFYGAFNSNLDGHKFNDHTTLSTLLVHQQGFVGMVENTLENTIQLSPNPAQDYIYFESKIHPKQPINKVTLFDISGNLVMEEYDCNQLDLARLSKGIYFISLLDQTGIETRKKFVKL